jgi:hypothetical protein
MKRHGYVRGRPKWMRAIKGSTGSTKSQPTASRRPRSTQQDFEPFESSWIFKKLHALGQTWVSVLLIWFSLILLSMAILARTGHLNPNGEWRYLLSDLIRVSDRFLPFEVKLPDRAQSFPFLGDLPSLVVLGVLGIHFAMLFHQFRLIEVLITELRANGVLEIHARDEVLDKINRDFRTVAKVVCWPVSLSLAAVVSLAQNDSGVFWSLAPPKMNASDWAHVAYSGWWAGAHDPVGRIIYFLLAAIIFHLVVAQNHVGISILVFFRKNRGIVKKTPMWPAEDPAQPATVDLFYNLSDPDGYYGWEPLQRLTVIVRWSVLTNMLALGAVLQTFGPTPVLESASILTNVAWGVLASTVGLSIAYLIAPRFIVMPGLKARKRAMREEAQREYEDAVSKLGTQEQMKEVSALRKKLRKINKLPSFPISPPKDSRRLRLLDAVTKLASLVGIAVVADVITRGILG